MDVQISKGYDIKVAGQAAKEIVDLQTDRVAYELADFRYLKPRVLVKEGDQVSKGTPIICDKQNTDIVFVAPVSGTIEAINRGDRRVLLNVIIKKSGDQVEKFEILNNEQIAGMNSEAAIKTITYRGLWPMLRRRPYHKIADTSDTPSSIFITALDSNPLAADPGFYLADRTADIQTAINILGKICPKIHLCIDANGSGGQAFSGLQGVEVHRFGGLHPRGNLSIHIDNVDPVMDNNKQVWSINIQNLAAMGRTLSSGEFDSSRVFAWCGPTALERKYYRTDLGANLNQLPTEEGENRLVTGSVLNGRTLGNDAFLGFYDHNIIALHEGHERQFLGWMQPGTNAHSLTRCYLTSVLPKKEYKMNTSYNGDFRAIVDSEMYDKVQPLDIHTAFLYKSLLAGDIDEAERLGLWSVAPEDFALASYMDPSKNNFADALTSTLDVLYKEESTSSHG